GDPVHVALGVASRPYALAAADFDGDGKKDVAVASAGSNDVTVLRNDGRGGLREAGRFASGPHPVEVLAADLDGDGAIDLAIPNHETSYVTLLRGDGKGSFRAFPHSPLTVHSKPHLHTLDACDADGDGWLDLIVDDWGENRLTLVRADGKGGFRGPGTPIDVGRKPYRNLVAKDLDGDGRCDLVTPSYDAGVVTILIGDGRGGFRAGPPIPAGPAPFTVAIADVNRDGKLDLVLENYSGQITDPSDDALTFLLGDGKGGFRLGPRIPTGRGPFDVAAGDIDGDGYADAVTANYGSADLTVSFGGPDGLSPARTVSVPVGSKPERVLLTDLNGDGKADAVAISTEGHDVTVLLAR
ncbi:MAG: VCBS repeat-containing protein, partial [Thermoanaerobaculia bacterium]